MFAENFNQRPDCKDLLVKMDGWIINKNEILLANNLIIHREFVEYLKEPGNEILSSFFDAKTGNSKKNTLLKKNDNELNLNKQSNFSFFRNTSEEIYSDITSLIQCFNENDKVTWSPRIIKIFRETPDTFQFYLAKPTNQKKIFKSMKQGEIYFSLIVTDNDQVVSFHQNIGESENEFTIIPELCDQNIEDFFEGTECMFARNNKGLIYSWGTNTWGQLLSDKKMEYFNQVFRPQIITFFSDKKHRSNKLWGATQFCPILRWKAIWMGCQYVWTVRYWYRIMCRGNFK